MIQRFILALFCLTMLPLHLQGAGEESLPRGMKTERWLAINHMLTELIDVPGSSDIVPRNHDKAVEFLFKPDCKGHDYKTLNSMVESIRRHKINQLASLTQAGNLAGAAKDVMYRFGTLVLSSKTHLPQEDIDTARSFANKLLDKLAETDPTQGSTVEKAKAILQAHTLAPPGSKLFNKAFVGFMGMISLATLLAKMLKFNPARTKAQAAFDKVANSVRSMLELDDNDNLTVERIEEIADDTDLHCLTPEKKAVLATKLTALKTLRSALDTARERARYSTYALVLSLLGTYGSFKWNYGPE